MRMTIVVSVVLLPLTSCAVALAQNEYISNGSFEHQDLTLDSPDSIGGWVLRNHGAEQLSVEVVSSSRENGGRSLRYQNTGKGSHNIHVDQLVPVAPKTIYEVRARVRGDGELEPMIAVQTKDWSTLTTVSCGKQTDWHEVRLLFQSFDNELVRFEWFPGAQGRLHTGVAGTSWIDDVSIRPMKNPSSSLLRSFALQQPHRDQEIDLKSVSVGATGNPLPLRRITARDGVLYYADGTEVALWGVNIQTALSWEYNGRLKHTGVPHTADALKEISAQNLDHMPLLEAGVIRMHLLPADFSGPNGEIRDTIYLDVLDDLIAQCRDRGIYVYLTLMNEMNTSFCRDSFVVGHERVEWVFDPKLVAKSERYVHEFLNRVNRYTGIRYADDPTIAVIEILNEPHYPTLDDLNSDTSMKACAEAFEIWQSKQQGNAPPEAVFATYRYETVLRYLDRMRATVRNIGCPAPVVWNLNWPRMINSHEDIFQAAADSAVDAVSFCCYPGQSDVANPFWANPADLSGNNYLPYLQTCYRDYSYLRWILGKRFEKKAKVAYEFESMYNHSAHIYPAMARLFRSLGSQIAPMWQYTLSPIAEYRGGSHYLNAYCTPRKAVSFRIASRVFAATRRLAPFDLTAKTEMVGQNWAMSFDKDLSLWSSNDTFLNSDNIDWNPIGEPNVPKTIAGYGNSPLVSYDGTGQYVLEFSKDQAELLILPDVSYTYPIWQRRNFSAAQRLCELTTDVMHVFELHVEGWTTGAEVIRLTDNESVPIARNGPRTRFLASPGRYQLSRSRTETR